MDDPTTAGVTEGFGLIFYQARWYDPCIMQFNQPDTLIPDLYNPLDWNRYSYTRYNPLKYTDPSGHAVVDGDDGGCSSDCMNRSRQNYLFSLAFEGSGKNGTWTAADWRRYYANRDKFWSNPAKWTGSPETWETFAEHVERLASNYESSEKDQFVRDFALLFAGISYDDSWTQAAMDSSGGPEVLPILNLGNQGLHPDHVDTIKKQESQAHHYAGIFFLAYFAEPEIGFVVNLVRDTKDVFSEGINYGDINLGTQASIDAYYFRYYASDLSVLGTYIRDLIVP